jgi:hypothetical protein
MLAATVGRKSNDFIRSCKAGRWRQVLCLQQAGVSIHMFANAARAMLICLAGAKGDSG